LPEPEIPDFPIRAYEFYDYHHELDNDTFVNYADNDTRKTGAISYLMFTSFGMSSNNVVERAKFENAKPVYFPPMEDRWSNDDYGSTSFRSSVFRDKDGSVGGVPNSYILINDGVAIDDACEVKPAWNAAVCKGDVGRVNIGAGAPGGGRGAGAGPGAAKGKGGPAAAKGKGGPGAAKGKGKGGGGFPAGTFNRSGLRGPVQPAITLSRNGRDFPYYAATNVRAGTEVKVTTEQPNVNLSVSELDRGSWVIFELPGFTTAASGTERASLDALRAANDTSYYKGNGSLWVKLVSSGDVLGSQAAPASGGASLQASR
jgi:cell migration-inducing and hyaluronan-binding protein